MNKEVAIGSWMLGEAPTVGEGHVQSGYAEEFGEQNGGKPLGLSVLSVDIKGLWPPCSKGVVRVGCAAALPLRAGQ